MGMITLCIRYTLDSSKIADFEDYARRFPEPIERCGGTLVGYHLPTKIAGPTNFAVALIDFPSLAAYEIYRDNLLADADAVENVRRMEKSGCVLIEDRSILRRGQEKYPAHGRGGARLAPAASRLIIVRGAFQERSQLARARRVPQ